jgi:hypothetical protein
VSLVLIAVVPVVIVTCGLVTTGAGGVVCVTVAGGVTAGAVAVVAAGAGVVTVVAGGVEPDDGVPV